VPSRVEIFAVTDLPEVDRDVDLAAAIADAIRRQDLQPQDDDVCVVTSKIVSKAEGRTIDLKTVTPSTLARGWATAHGKDPRVVEVVLSESVRVVKMDRDILIVETRHGFVCANAGVDGSNVPSGHVLTLPIDPDASAKRLSDELSRAFGCRVPVIVSDTFGRPWREGLVNVAIGVAGLAPLRDYRGLTDDHGRTLSTTVIALADEIASAAELVMEKTARVPAAIVRGLNVDAVEGSGRALVRAPDRDLFR
jgi:coenzyme F420-0:L-glutamate ligase/coenzyme F420-1:gamma-L-glutamate ligase